MKTFKRSFHSDGVQPTALLVESSEDYAILFARNFAKIAQHWELITVPDGSGAIHHMTHNGLPNLFVTCFHTPRLDALDVIEWIRVMKSPAPVSVLVYDSVPEPSLRSQLTSLGVNDYLDKNAPEEKVRQVLIRVVEQVERDVVSTSPVQKVVE